MSFRPLLAFGATALLVAGLGAFLPRQSAPAREAATPPGAAAAPAGGIVGPGRSRPLAEIAADFQVTADGAKGLPPAEAAFEAALEASGEADPDAIAADPDAAAADPDAAGARPNRIGDELSGRERLPLPRATTTIPRASDPTISAPTGTVTRTPIGSIDLTTGLGDGKAGIGGNFSVQYAPPDLAMDVSPDQIVQLVNVAMMVFDKRTRSVQLGPIGIKSLFSGLPSTNPCAIYDDGDPQVRWDARAGRWIVGQFAVSGSTDYMCLAVSQTADATGAWNAYAFSKTLFPDYPKLSIWRDAYYVTYNMFGSTFQYATVCSYNRAKMLAGTAFSAGDESCFNTSSTYGSLLAADLDGTVEPPAGARNVMVALGSDTSSLAFWSQSSGTGASSGPASATVAGYTIPCSGGGACIPQQNSRTNLDSLGDRLMSRFAVRWTQGASYGIGVVTHSVAAGSVTGVRWYRIRVESTGGASVVDSGTWSPDTSLHRWMASAALNTASEMAIGYSASSASAYPSIRVAGRTTTSGQFDVDETVIRPGLGSQTSTYSRWGDYTQMAVDPDGCTFWYVNEFYDVTASFRWRTAIASFRLPGGSCNPGAVSTTPQGSTSLAASNTTPFAGKNFTITVTLKNSGESPLVGRTVGMTGFKSGIATTNASGQATFTVKAPNRTGSSMSFRFTFGGDLTNGTSTTLLGPIYSQ